MSLLVELLDISMLVDILFDVDVNTPVFLIVAVVVVVSVVTETAAFGVFAVVIVVVVLDD